MTEGLSWYELPFAWTGLNTPALRFFAVFSVTNSYILFVKPEFAFTHRGEMKEWALLNANPDPRQRLTWIPWWLPSIALGTAAALFI
jgi:hypothetical protein